MGWMIAAYAVRVATYGVIHSNVIENSRRGSPALGIAATEASHASIHHDYRGGRTLGAQLRPFRIMRLGKRIRLLGPSLKLSPFLIHQLLLMLIQLGRANESNGLQMLLNHMPQLGND